MLHQRRAEGCRNRFGGEVIRGGAEAAGGDQHLTTLSGSLQLSDQTLAVIAHHSLAMVGDAQGRQLLSNPARIAIGDVAEQQLGADAQDFSRHGWPVARY